MLFADVIVPLSVPNMFTYEIPPEFASVCKVGSRVVVQFGNRKFYSAVIRRLHNQPPAFETKPVVAVLDDYPLLGERDLLFWEWIADYYMANLGDVFVAAMPAAFRLESQTQITLNIPEDELDEFQFSENEQVIVDALKKQKTLTLGKVSKLLNLKNPLRVVNPLLDKKVIRIYEFYDNPYKTKLEKYVELSPEIKDSQQLNSVLRSLSRAKKQTEVLVAFMVLSKLKFNEELKLFEYEEVKKKDLLEKAGASAQVFKELVKKGILVEVKKPVLRLQSKFFKNKSLFDLTEKQREVLQSIENQFNDKQVVLFYGITGSGKTEVYLHLIKKYLKAGKQVLYLLPEIALTAQIIERLKSIFGESVGVYHSKFSDEERAEVFRSVKEEFLGKHYKVILGVRSAIFLPFKNLGLIIVDEEHETTYKQTDPAPRYHARDAAIYLAKLTGAKVLLGSATPSIESFHNAQKGKYGYVELTERFGGVQMPEILIANEREARKKRQMKSLFHPLVLDNVKSALNNGEQVILFRNRRGFAPYVECATCGWIPKCKHCDVSLTYHSDINMLVCHYCGYKQEVPQVCEVCGDRAMETRSFGTQKIENELQIFFPDAKIERLDLDATRRKYAHEEIIYRFSKGEIDILIGTQMVTKGLDFEKVNTVGILNADNSLFFPDFRANERSFQLFTQVSGRAGRRHKQGKVIIQTSHPEHPVMRLVLENNYKKLYETEIVLRRQFGYPPFTRLIKLSIKHSNPKTVNGFAEKLEVILKKSLGKKRVLGPHTPVVKRIKNQYILEFLIKVEKVSYLPKIKNFLKQSVENIKSFPGFSNVAVIYNVDP